MSILSMSYAMARFVAVNAFLGFFKFEQIKKYIYIYIEDTFDAFCRSVAELLTILTI